MVSNTLIEKKMKGSATQYKGGAFEFTPYGEGTAVYAKLSKVGNCSLSKTTGEKDVNYVAHLKTPANSPDPAADLRDQLEKLVQSLEKGTRKVTPRGRTLAKEEGYVCTLNATKGTIEIGIAIDLREHVDYVNYFNKLSINLSKCLQFNDTSIRTLCKELAKTSTPSRATKDTASA